MASPVHFGTGMMQALSNEELHRVSGGLTVREAGRNAIDNVQQWGRAVWGRAALGAGFAGDSSRPVDTYSKQLENYDLHYKPVLPNQW